MFFKEINRLYIIFKVNMVKMKYCYNECFLMILYNIFIFCRVVSFEFIILIIEFN